MNLRDITKRLDELAHQWGNLDEAQNINHMIWVMQVNQALDNRDWETLKVLSKDRNKDFFTAPDHEKGLLPQRIIYIDGIKVVLSNLDLG